MPAGGRVALADGSVLIVKADTLMTGGGSGFPGLSDTGLPFAFVDRNVRNSFTYYYAVTAFDVNSVKSGPTSLESARITKAVRPRRSSSNAVQTVVQQQLQGEAGVVLDPASKRVTLDGRPVTLSAREYALLHDLLTRPAAGK